MFKIRKEQEEIFRQQALREFEDKAVQHLRRDLSEQTASFSDDDLRLRVRQCIPRSSDYGLTTQKQIICFVDVSFLLGEQFDTDPSHAWAGELLKGQKLSATNRANLLLATACSVYKESAAGS